jgi:hypothetical protein
VSTNLGRSTGVVEKIELERGILQNESEKKN